MSFRHRFVSPLIDDGNATVIGPAEWNDVLVLDEGTTDQALIRDEGDLDDGLKVGVVTLFGGGTGTVTAAAARDALALNVYSRAEIDARRTATPLTVAQGGTGATTTGGPDGVWAKLDVFTKEEVQGGVALTGLQLATDATLRSAPTTLMKRDASGVIHLGGPGATGIAADAPFAIPADTAITADGMELIHASSGGVLTLGRAGVTRILFGADLALDTNTWIRASDGTRLLGAASSATLWVAPDRHAYFCQGGSGNVTFFGDVTIPGTFSVGATAIVDPNIRQLTLPDAGGPLNFNRYVGELEAMVTALWRDLVVLEGRVAAL